MRTRIVLSFAMLATLLVLPATSATLNVSASDVFSTGLYNYTYIFSVGGGNVDNLYLGSDDLSPLTLSFQFDNAATTNWSWLGNNAPQDYLQFFTTNGSFLTPSDTLKVTFSSVLAPSTSHFAVALNSVTGAVTPEVTGILAPTAVPEPSSLRLLSATVLLSLIAGVGVRHAKIGVNVNRRYCRSGAGPRI